MNFSEKHISLFVQGTQAAEFLQGQITIDTEKISNKDFKPACICNNKGRVMATFWIKKQENGFRVAILEELCASFEEHMNKYIPFFDAQLKKDERDNLKKELDSTEWMKFLVNKGIVEVNKHTSSKFTPHELNYQNNELIDFSKGCFNGQEVIARMEYRGKLKFALKISDNLQDEIKESSVYNQEGKKIGEVLSKEGKYGFIFFKNKDNQSEPIFLDGHIINTL
jgi:folate-binding protein YgfZ